MDNKRSNDPEVQEFVKVVQLVYDLDTEDPVEQQAIAAVVGGEVYDAIMVFKRNNLDPLKAAKFMVKIKDVFNAIRLIGGLKQ